MGILKKILVSAVGAAASYYVTKVVTAALERKPLKARVRDGKQKVADIAGTAKQKAVDTKETMMAKAEAAKAAATAKAHQLYDGGENKIDPPRTTTYSSFDDEKKDL